MSESKKIESLTEDLEQYIGTAYELNKLEAIERYSAVGASMVSAIIVALFVMLFALFVSIALGFYLCARIGDTYSGFFIVGVCYLTFALVLGITRKQWLNDRIHHNIIRKVLNKA